MAGGVRFAVRLAALGGGYAALGLGATLWGPLCAHAQTRTPDVTHELEVIDSTERGLDPLGLDESTGKQLDEAAQRLEAARQRAAAPKPLLATRGEVLSSVDGVQEVAHQVHIQLAQGLAFVHTELRLESRAAQAAQVAYRLPCPADAALTALEVCLGTRCVAAGPEATSANEADASAQAGQEPWAEARRIDDLRGAAFALRASRVQRGMPLSLRIDYVAKAELHAGVVHFRLPARGYDPRLTQSEIAVEAAGFRELTPPGSVALDPNLALELRATLDTKQPGPKLSTRASCGGHPCSRSFEAAAPAAPLLRETWLWLDASPSMEGSARNVADRALTALLAQLPETTLLRAFAFAAEARELGRFEAERAPLALLSDALVQDLGRASRPGAALQLAKADLSRARPRVLLLSDGKLDQSAVHALSSLRRQGAELWWIALSDEPSLLEAVCDGVIRVASELDGERSEELIAAALAPQLKNGLHAGEQRVRESAPKVHVPRTGESWLSYWLARKRPWLLRTRGVAGPGAIVAPAYVSVAPPPRASDSGMPKESVLSMLRNQLVPQARGCLRSDRKGRGDYAVALTFHALFADREAYDVRVEGKIPDALRSCLSDVVPRLRIPAFSGRIRVRYPIHTEREPESPVIELEGEAREQVERVIGAKGHESPPL